MDLPLLEGGASMIKRLYLNNCFRHQDRTFTFEKGLTGVVGPNESGKSLIVEMIRYALFGSKALRGVSEDYRKLHVELDFEVNGRLFEVVRKGSRATLTERGDPGEEPQMVSGTRPVNDAIRQILGYDLTVFDVANACNQGDVEKLSNMAPAERKQMVDQTVGLTVLDEVIRFCGDEGNALKREAAALESVLRKPVKPEDPGVRKSDEIAPELKQAVKLAEHYHQLRGQLANRPAEPVRPEKCPVPEKLEVLLDQQEEREEILGQMRKLERELKNLAPEEWDEEDLDEFEAQHERAERWQQREKLLAQGHHECPKCHHQWPVADLGNLESVTETHPPAISRQQIRGHRSRLGNKDRIAALTQAIDELEDMLLSDRSEEIDLVRAWKAKVKAYESAKEAYDLYNHDLPRKQAELEELEGVDTVVSSLREELDLARTYERDLARYQKEMTLYEEYLKAHETLCRRSEAFLESRQSVQDLKVRVKTHLLPSLNKVASLLLSQMTGGERYRVEVDPDFEIAVDGQSIRTLSGSGKAVANLAIRIALGQILTNRVFSVFLADEVDAAMDDERATYTSEALRRLTNSVGQVIQVTHKRPNTDHMFELKK